jgi:hypothetical protein
MYAYIPAKIRHWNRILRKNVFNRKVLTFFLFFTVGLSSYFLYMFVTNGFIYTIAPIKNHTILEANPAIKMDMISTIFTE